MAQSAAAMMQCRAVQTSVLLGPTTYDESSSPLCTRHSFTVPSCFILILREYLARVGTSQGCR